LLLPKLQKEAKARRELDNIFSFLLLPNFFAQIILPNLVGFSFHA